MIIPIGHDQTIRRYPWVTIGIIALCTIIHIYASFGAPKQEDALDLIYELQDATTEEEGRAIIERAEAMLEKVPAWRLGYRTDQGLSYRLVTSAFVHGGWFHLIGNMLFLWLAGSALEDRWGRIKYIVFYVLGAAAAALAFAMTHDGEPVNLIGASGAISALMGAFLVYFSGAQIRLWWYFMYRSGIWLWPAYVALPLWLANEGLWAYLEKSSRHASPVAYMAHVGGFVFGCAVAWVLKAIFKDGLPTDDDDEVEDARPAAAAPKFGAAREKQLVEAIEKRDLGVVRTVASRVLIDLNRTKDHARALDLYRSIADAGWKTIPLTDGAFVAAADAAEARGEQALFIEIVIALRAAHPGSTHVAKAMWRVAQLYGREGVAAEELATLKLLAESYPRSEHGIRAAEELARRG